MPKGPPRPGSKSPAEVRMEATRKRTGAPKSAAERRLEKRRGVPKGGD